MFLGITIYVLRPTQSHFSPFRQAKVIMTLRRHKNTIMLQNINYFTIIYTFGGY